MVEQSSPALDSTVSMEATDVLQLSNSWLKTARISWVILALAAGAILLTSLPGYVQTFEGQLAHISEQNQTNITAIFAALSGVASLASALLSFILAVVFFRRRFTESVAAGLSFYLLLYAVIMAGPLEHWSAYWLGDQSLALRLQSGLIAVPTIALLVLFPNGRFVPKWSRWVLLLSVPFAVSLFLLPTTGPSGITGSMPILVAVLAACLIGFYALGFYAQYHRYRHVSSPIERQQTKWVVYGLALWLVYMLLSSFPYYYLENLPLDAPIPWWASISVLGWFMSLSIVPICLTIAVTRYRLWDIDILINRTLVYGVLTAVIVGLYISVVGGIGALFQTQGNKLITLIATGLVAVLFQPIRDRLQRGANRLLYGHRHEPFEVLARLGQRLESTMSPETVYPTIVETVAQVLKLPYAAIAIYHQGQLETAVAYGKRPAHFISYPLTYQSEEVGQLILGPRQPDETFNEADDLVLRNIARQAGTAVHAVQLTADLQQSRLQIVTSREEERRRLRRDLHDGLGPSLAAHMLKIGSARALLTDQPQTTDQLLAEMETDIENTLTDLRRIIYNLRPPALDQLGLVGALQAYAETCEQNSGDAQLTIHIDVPDVLPPLPAAVEVAAYHIGREGLTNVVRHAQASHCDVQLRVEGGANGRLHLAIEDNGQGIHDAVQTGVGLTSIHERADELGGSCVISGHEGKGTRVTAVLPLMPNVRSHGSET
jgi:signal transduction histidine kinase